MLSRDKKFTGVSLTFDDVLLLPGYSDVLPNEVSVQTTFAGDINLSIPICSSAMDTVTESRLAIAIAQEGGIGVLHKNMPIEKQASEVDKVKRSESGMIYNPYTLRPNDTIGQALDLMAKYRISGIPITEDNNKLVGILTNRDLRFAIDPSAPIHEHMTQEKLVTAPVGMTLEDAQSILQQHRIEKLPVVDSEGYLKGLITIKDIEKKRKFPFAAKDPLGRLRVAAAIGVSEEDTDQRAGALLESGVDALVIDTAHGFTKRVGDAVKRLRQQFPEAVVVAGNVGTADGARFLCDLGVHAVKVGMGPGSICTTRVISGTGVPQISAVYDCAEAMQSYPTRLIADGGIKFSGDVVKAIAAGADCVMIGSLFAGTEESPGETIIYGGRTFKLYRGMGSVEAMKQGSKDRYGQAETIEEQKLVAEGIEGRVPYKGSLSGIVFQLVGGVRSGMGYCGVRTIPEMHKEARFIQITEASLKESHPHDVFITKEAPNYRLGN